MPPVVLLTGAGAGDNITLPLDAEPTSILLAEVGSGEDGEAFIVVVPDVTGEGSEVHESRGGLGALQSVLDIPLFDIAPSSAPEVASSYATTWVRVGVNRAQALYDTVTSSVFHTFPLYSIEFRTMHSVSFF